MLNDVNIILGGLPNMHIHQGLIKLNGNSPVVRMYIIFANVTFSHIMKRLHQTHRPVTLKSGNWHIHGVVGYC